MTPEQNADLLLRAEQILRTIAEDEKRSHPQIRQTAAMWLADFEVATADAEDE